MNFIKRFKGILITIGISAIILTISFYFPEQKSTSTDEKVNEPIYENVLVETAEPAIEEPVEAVEPTKNETKETATPIPTPAAPLETKEPAGTPDETVMPMPTSVAPLESKKPADATEEKNALSCTLTVRCDTVLNNIESIAPEKVQLVPQNGVILPETKLEFSEGDTVFDVLEKELKSCKIHLEFSKVSMYDSVYIEGIGNLYEFDASNLSGWIYRVNGKVPSVGCSQYKLKNGDRIEFLYTCNMGKDL